MQENLRTLGVDTLDLVNLRMGDASGPRAGSLAEAFEDPRPAAAGRPGHHLGVSNVTAEQVAESADIAPVVCVQNLYNLAVRHDDDLLDDLARDGIAYVPFFPLGGFTPLQSQALSAVAHRLSTTPMAVGAQLAAAAVPERAAHPGHEVRRPPARERRGCRDGPAGRRTWPSSTHHRALTGGNPLERGQPPGRLSRARNPTYRWRADVDDDDLLDLVASHGGDPEPAGGPASRAHSLGWVTAHDGDVLVGFVNVAWDGGDHAFLLDTKTRPPPAAGRRHRARAARRAGGDGGGVRVAARRLPAGAGAVLPRGLRVPVTEAGLVHLTAARS